jgi:Tfp pilus assembly protein PilN
MGDVPKMPRGNSQGIVVWYIVVICSVALNQYRICRNDKMHTENERVGDALQTETERLHNQQQAEIDLLRNQQHAKNGAYKTHAEVTNKKPWFRNKPPEPPKIKISS